MPFNKYWVLDVIFTLPIFMSTARGIGTGASYTYTLAVKKKYWGMGVDWKLLAEALKRLREMGFEIVVARALYFRYFGNYENLHGLPPLTTSSRLGGSLGATSTATMGAALQGVTAVIGQRLMAYHILT